MHPEWGGPTKVVSELTQTLAQKGIQPSIFTVFTHRYNKTLVQPNGVELKAFPEPLFGKIWATYSPTLQSELYKSAKNYDLIHIHELWGYAHFAAHRAALAAEIPYIITVHGALDKWRLNISSFRKKIYTHFIQRNSFEKAAAIHALVEEEINEIRQYASVNNIFVIPNGINLRDYAALPSPTQFEQQYPELKNKMVILFMGRIHFMKGLDILAKSFGNIVKQNPKAHLVIAGPENNSYKKEIIATLEKGNALKSTTFTGMIQGKEKLSALSRADIFVLPSYSEGFSMSIIEALACSLPVVITTGCKFTSIIKNNAGFVIDPNAEQLTNKISVLLNSEALRSQMGANGKMLVSRDYTWDSIANRMIIEYQKYIKK